MKNRLLITVSDVKGTKTYNIHKFVRRFAWIFVLSILVILGISFWYIDFLNTNVSIINEKQKTLTAQNEVYSMQIKQKIKKIDQLGSKLEYLEDALGIKDDDSFETIQKAVLQQMSKKQKEYFLSVIPSGSPLKHTVVTSNFGYRIHPISKKKKFHQGIDFRAHKGTDVFATADGIVKKVQKYNSGSFGRLVVIAHNYGFETAYAHLNKVLVEPGQVIKKGDLIAKSGNSGRSAAPHLHYEVRYLEKVLNPKDFVYWNIDNYDNLFEKQRRVKWQSLVKMISRHNASLVQQ
jgi:murein DD-endopeptidase MepM/ murein hydrolase activator NlpD